MAAEAKVAMCPPSSEETLFALTTIAAAFHLTRDLIFFSISWFPGDFASNSVGIVFT